MTHPLPTTRCAVRVVGLGSPHGDDQAGWRLADWLQQRTMPEGVEVVVASDVPDLLELCDGCQTMILVDACRSGQPAGSVHRYDWPDPGIAMPSSPIHASSKRPGRTAIGGTTGAIAAAGDGLWNRNRGLSAGK